LARPCDRRSARGLRRSWLRARWGLWYGHRFRAARELIQISADRRPGARIALADAGIKIEDVDGIKTHNPFAVNDVYLSRQTGVPVEEMNDFGSSLVYGHPQGPTSARLIAELIEQLKRRGGGVGLFTGCAAGDTGAALVLRVGD
jgi:hypothetical protein